MERLINLINVVSLALMLIVLLSLRRQRIRPEYAVAWLGACAALFILSRWAGPALWLQNALGLPDRPLALILIVSAVFLIVFGYVQLSQYLALWTPTFGLAEGTPTVLSIMRLALVVTVFIGVDGIHTPRDSRLRSA